jgi:predicted MFS family arabinose efflux permease
MRNYAIKVSCLIVALLGLFLALCCTDISKHILLLCLTFCFTAGLAVISIFEIYK